MPIHEPVLLEETLNILQLERGGVFIDATLGFAGHAGAMLERAKKAGTSIQVIGVDQDMQAIQQVKERFGKEITYLHGNFSELASIRATGIAETVDGILMDLGVSSYQLDTAARGFSFQQAGPLDMRMDERGTVTAASIVNTWPEKKLAHLFFKYGEEKLANKIARAIVHQRKIKSFYTTTELANLITEQYHPALRHKKPHPATRVFQALRIEVNRELDSLERGLKAATALLAPNGVLAVISFHSLEDRIVKQYFRECAANAQFALLTKKPITPTREEEQRNPRSRSAKLRAIRRISG